MASKDSRRSIITGFIIVIGLLITLTAIASLRLADIDQKQEQFFKHETTKFEIFQAMRKIARERTLIIFTAMHETDVFARDEALMRFNGLAREFIKLRLRLEHLALYPDEDEHFEKAKSIIRRTSPLQDEIMRHLVEDNMQAANALIRLDIPREQELWHVFDEVVAASQQHLAEVATANDLANRRATVTIIILGIFAVIISLLAMVRVIQQVRDYQQALRSEKDFAEMTLSSIGDAVIAADKEGKITFINLAAQKILGCTAPQATGKPLRRYYDVLTEDGRRREDHIAFEHFMDGPVASVAHYHVLKLDTGAELIIEDVISPMHDGHGEFLGNTIIFRDVTQARLFEQQLSWQALHDPLTGLANRLQFESRLKEMITEVHHKDIEHVLLVIDLDNFKPVNDTSGHMAGDMLLKEVARTLAGKMRKSDTLARLGGDEFAILLDGCSVEQAMGLAESIRTEIENIDFSWKGQRFNISASIGVTLIDKKSTSGESIFTQADEACYAAKAQGRNRVVASITAAL